MSSSLVSPSAGATASAQGLTESINAATTSTALPALTPRSAEACRRNGIDPRELVPLPVEAFAEPDQPQELQEVKFAHYEAGRKEAFRLVQAERERVIQEQARGALRSSTSAGGGIAALGAAPKVSAGRARSPPPTDGRRCTRGCSVCRRRRWASTTPPRSA